MDDLFNRLPHFDPMLVYAYTCVYSSNSHLVLHSRISFILFVLLEMGQFVSHMARNNILIFANYKRGDCFRISVPSGATFNFVTRLLRLIEIILERYMLGRHTKSRFQFPCALFSARSIQFTNSGCGTSIISYLLNGK